MLQEYKFSLVFLLTSVIDMQIAKITVSYLALKN